MLLELLIFNQGIPYYSYLFKQSSILKFQNKIYLENVLFVRKFLSNLSPSVFNAWYSFFSDQHKFYTVQPQKTFL